MNKSDASQTLQNILDACQPAEASSYNETVKASIKKAPGIHIRIVITVITLIFTILMPLLFAPKLVKSHYNTSVADVSIKSYNIEDGILSIDFNGQFIDLQSAYAISESGKKVLPSNIDIWKNQIHFEYDGTEWNIYIDDTNGNTVHMLLIPPQ